MTGFPKLQNRLRGRKAKNVGSAFEELFLRAARLQRIAVSRIHDGCKRVGPNPRDLIRRKQPFDWVLSLGGLTALIDTKSVAGKCLPCSAIDPNQRRELASHASRGAIAGYVAWLRDTQEFVFIPAQVLVEKARLKRGSISGKDAGVIHLGNESQPNLARIFESYVTGLVTALDQLEHAASGAEKKGMH